MSLQMSDRVCYLPCNICNTILVVSVPCGSMSLGIVTVKCGHCANIFYVNTALLQPISPHQHHNHQKQLIRNEEKTNYHGFGSSSFQSLEPEVPPTVLAPVKRPRVPSAYNRFIKEEIKRIKASNPDITHREAFSTAAKNWAHFPHIRFGLNLGGETSR